MTEPKVPTPRSKHHKRLRRSQLGWTPREPREAVRVQISPLWGLPRDRRYPTRSLLGWFDHRRFLLLTPNFSVSQPGGSDPLYDLKILTGKAKPSWAYKARFEARDRLLKGKS